MEGNTPDHVVGHTDGFRFGHIVGWAWYPDRPQDTVVVQVLADGEVVAEGAACIPRPDLKTAGIGHGRHAFSIPFVMDPKGPASLHIVVRAKDGATLTDGEFDIETSEEARAEAARRRSLDYLEQVFGPFTAPVAPAPRPPLPPASPALNFVLYSATAGTALATALGAPQYSYFFVMREFREVLRRLGTVHVVRHPADADRIHDVCAARGEACVMLSFAPPQSTTHGLRCPVVPVIAWEFSTIPTETWDENRQNDWRVVLRQTGRAITISEFAARAVRACMGPDFPVAGIPTPVWDRLGALRARIGSAAASPEARVALKLDGFTWDSRIDPLTLTMHTPPLPRPAQRAAAMAAPVRAAQLRLAAASAEAQRHAHAAAEAAARAQAEAERVRAAREAAETEAERAAAEVRAAEERATADALAEAAARKTWRRRLRTTARYGVLWYRDVVRDSLPRPVRGGISTAGRVAAALRRPAMVAHAPTEAPPPVPVAEATPVPADMPYTPAIETRMPVAEAPAARCLPAPDFAPIPEPQLADFDPNPFPDAPPPAPAFAPVVLDGTVFTAVFSPKDGRKNWQDILTAFTAAFAGQPDATLVMKMIGTDPAYWWWEFHDLAKTLPPFACRVLVLQGFLDDANYQSLIEATHFVVNASLAEGQCLPLVEFMSGRRPAIAPLHTAMLDYITPANAVIVASGIEFCSWPHDPRNHLNTTRHRIEWPSLRDAFRAAWRILHDDPARYAAMADAAAATMEAYCSDDTVAAALTSFLGLGGETVTRAGWQPRASVPAEALP